MTTSSNELAVPTTQPGIVMPAPDASDAAIERMVKQAKAMDAAYKIGSALAGTAMVPQHFQGKPDDCAAAILLGAELGLSASQSLQNLFVVRGKPAMYARVMVALVIAAGHTMAEVEASPEAVEWVGRRADTGVEFVSRWTIERARTAGFTSNKLYESMPIEMLRAKAQSEVARTLFPDVLLGIAYSREELELEVPATPRTVPAAGGGVDGLKQRLAARQAPATATPEPEPVQPAEPAITAAQLKKLHVLLGKWELTDREQALAWLSQQVDRQLASSKDLTKAEATSLIDFMEAEQARDQEAGQARE